mmetsp:Transcript_63260/g.196269  ORF Transcript_63260/g.196269 Transcript_63260/m.196269 type:complete len:225 (-) Transcript_63260:126-800(-)
MEAPRGPARDVAAQHEAGAVCVGRGPALAVHGAVPGGADTLTGDAHRLAMGACAGKRRRAVAARVGGAGRGRGEAAPVLRAPARGALATAPGAGRGPERGVAVAEETAAVGALGAGGVRDFPVQPCRRCGPDGRGFLRRRHLLCRRRLDGGGGGGLLRGDGGRGVVALLLTAELKRIQRALGVASRALVVRRQSRRGRVLRGLCRRRGRREQHEREEERGAHHR